LGLKINVKNDDGKAHRFALLYLGKQHFRVDLYNYMQIRPRCNSKRNKHFVNDKEKPKIPNKQIGKYAAVRTIRHEQIEKIKVHYEHIF
jgi:hypothetical protein